MLTIMFIITVISFILQDAKTIESRKDAYIGETNVIRVLDWTGWMAYRCGTIQIDDKPINIFKMVIFRFKELSRNYSFKEYFLYFYGDIFAKLHNTFVCYTAKKGDLLYTYGNHGHEYIVNTHEPFRHRDEENFIVIKSKKGVNPANWLGFYTGSYKCQAHRNYLGVWADFF